MNDLFRDQRAVLAALLCLGLGLGFWSGSRYPELDEKAAMGGAAVLEDPLGFEAARPIDAADSFVVRVSDTTLNWVSTNQRGMAFGLTLAAAFMTLFRRVGRASFRGAFSNTLLGVVIGAPLGVCVNCAVPVARGLHASGTRVETSLAAMVSSPTLNFVVLAMLFSMFPLYVATLKLGASLLFILVAIPLLCRFVFDAQQAVPASALAAGPAWGPVADDALFDRNDSWGGAGRWVALEFAKNLWFILKTTVPLMLLAGLLGALAVTALPWETLTAALPRTAGVASTIWMLALACFGLFLPVPIAFDVVVSAALWSAGMPTPYVMVLLFSLGVFSVYSFLAVWEAMSLRAANALALTLVVLSASLGHAAQYYEHWDQQREETLFAAMIASEAGPAAVPPRPEFRAAASLVASLEPSSPWAPAPFDLGAGISVDRRPFAPRVGEGGPNFSKHYGKDLGIERVRGITVAEKFVGAFARAPIAAGDVHGDGFPDLVLGTDQGVWLYANHGGGRFESQEIEAEVGRVHVVSVALVDLNDDGWLDIVYATYGAGNHVLLNRGGRFLPDGLLDLPSNEKSVANALAFGDLDRDGSLDLVLGNYTPGSWRDRPPEFSRNLALRNLGKEFSESQLPAQPGQTMSSLLSDLDGDGVLDFIAGNDFDVPDAMYRGTGGGRLTRIERSEETVPYLGWSTMSLDSADIDNDGVLEFYLAQIARNARNSGVKDVRQSREVCKEHSDAAARERCRARILEHATVRGARKRDGAQRCLDLADESSRNDCVAFAMFRAATRDRDRSQCDRIPARWARFRDVCHLAFEAPAESEDPRLAFSEVRNRNLLYQRGDDSRYEERGRELGVAIGGWSWNAKFADVDNDEWQDLYIANGYMPSRLRETNVFFRNLKGETFENATKASGLESFFAASSYVYVDLDDDGDLDIVTTTFDGPVWVYRNQSQRNRSIVFELADERGNHFGIGSLVTIHYGDPDARRQVREIKASGGYGASEAPRAHFGMGSHDRVSQVDVRWSTGETTTLRGDFASGHRYRIRRTH